MLPKITPEAIGVWSRLLGRVSDSRLLLKSHYFADAETAARFHAAFEAEGIDPRRVLLHPAVPTTRAHLEKYGEVDIALDTFPYNGTTTTLEALWMGAPVVTLSGNRHASRVGASILTHCGFEHLVAATPEAYLDIAARLAADPEALAEMRRTLRSLVFVSPLCDTASFAAKIEGAYREMWRAWCAGELSG
jgi:predicted O-linked N-acetylglucosamine transferase (SPINDLY family)